MPEPGMIAITGANGYVGTALSRAFRAAGYRVAALQRSPGTDSADLTIPYTLESGPARPLPAEVAAIVHCAYDLRARRRADIGRINLTGVSTLLDAAGDIPVILISSMSAYPATAQIYGQTKLATESAVTARGGVALRLGLVYGGDDGGMIGALRTLAALPVVPMLRPDSYQYTVHVDDMARCVLDTVATRPPHRVLGVANPRRVPFSAIMAALHAEADPGAERTGPTMRTVPVPAAALHGALRVAEGAGLRLPFRADSMLGLRFPAPEVPFAEYWRHRGIVLREFGVGPP